MTALVFNCFYNGLSIIQELGRHGVEVLALDSGRSVGTYSRYARYLHCPDPLVAEEAFVAFLLQLGPTFAAKPVLFPTNDQWAVAVSRHKQALSEYYVPCVADWPTVDLLIQKQKFDEWAVQRGYPVPRSWPGTQFDRLPEGAFPLAAKPECRRISSDNPEARQLSHRLGQLRLTVLRNRKELGEFALLHAGLLQHLIFQEYVEGMSDRMYTVGVYADRAHNVLGLFTGRKVRGFPPDVGDCIVGQAEEVPSELRDMVRQLCFELQYHGIAEFEFKRDSVTDKFNLIEVNPRSWSWVGITPACGISLPWLAYTDLTNAQPAEPVESAVSTGSVKWARLLEDMLNCLRFNRLTGYPEWHMTPREWWNTLQAEHLVTADLAWDDPIPSLYSIYAAVRRALRRGGTSRRQ